MFRVYRKVYNSRSRYISLRYEYIRQLIIDGIVISIYARSSNNLVDPLTKGLSRDTIKIWLKILFY